ncbi:MAG: FxsA family protein [Planctomycetota bacterium]
MFLRLLAAFIFIPLVELIVLLRLADATSWITTLMIVLVTGFIGSYLARREGVAAWFRFQTALQNGRVPSVEIVDGVMIAFAAALLLTPGLLTDGLGFVLLTPIGRRWISGWLSNRYAARFEFHTAQSTRQGGPSHPDASTHGQGGGWTVDSPSFGPKQSP